MGHIKMLYIVGLLLAGNIASAAVLLDVRNTIVEYLETDIDVRCVVNDTSLGTSSFFTIQLIKSSKNVVSVAKDGGISWQDSTMQSRSGVSVNASKISTASAYLHLTISSDGVRYPDDIGSYQCDYSHFNPSSGMVVVPSQSVFVNITVSGFKEMTTESPTTWTTMSTVKITNSTTTELNTTAKAALPYSGASHCLQHIIPLVFGCIFLAIVLPIVQ